MPEALAPQVAGRIAKVLVNDNQNVEAGQTLVEIDPADFEARLAQARAGQAEAQGNLANAQAQQAVAQANLEQSKADVAVDMTGNATIKSSDNCFVGGLRTVGNSSVTPPPLPVCKTVADPFATYPLPTVGA